MQWYSDLKIGRKLIVAFAVVIMLAMMLALFAIPLSYVNPRAGRSLNLVLAILFYLIYNNLLSISQAWVAQEKIGLAAGLWGVHLILVVVLLILFMRRLTLFSITRMLGFR